MLGAFLAISVVVIVTPGQDTALTIRNTLSGGRRGGIATAGGVALGLATWTVAASAGVVTLLSASEPAFRALSSVTTPALAARVHVASPSATPPAVAIPPRRPPETVFRIVRAVSCPGVQMTTTDTATKAARLPSWSRLSAGISCTCSTRTSGSPG